MVDANPLTSSQTASTNGGVYAIAYAVVPNVLVLWPLLLARPGELPRYCKNALMASWDLLTERLSNARDDVRLSWSELSELVGGLPPSAAKYRAWWSGDRPHVRAWRSAGFTVHLVLGSEVTFSRTATADRGAGRESRAHAPAASAQWRSTRAAPPDVILVTCVKSKLDEPAAAKHLYTSALFTKQRQYAERAGVPWFILSAEHGLVGPDERLAPYERHLGDTSSPYRTAWGGRVAERLEVLVGPLSGKVIEVHAGASYLSAVAGPLQSKGATILAPLNGLRMGARLHWYGQQQPSTEASRSVTSSAEHVEAARFVDMLRVEANSVTPVEFRTRQGVGLGVPGMYSWWVDTDGAEDLAKGLGLDVSPGLIYAGLAGATRWPSGQRSGNTLWSRIAGMHLGGQHQFSTFRRTLGVIHAAAAGATDVDESALTVWMTQHLKVLAVPFADADSLGRLEQDVLTALNPPFNLRGMIATPTRLRIRELRRRLRT